MIKTTTTLLRPFKRWQRLLHENSLDWCHSGSRWALRQDPQGVCGGIWTCVLHQHTFSDHLKFLSEILTGNKNNKKRYLQTLVKTHFTDQWLAHPLDEGFGFVCCVWAAAVHLQLHHFALSVLSNKGGWRTEMYWCGHNVEEIEINCTSWSATQINTHILKQKTPQSRKCSRGVF